MLMVVGAVQVQTVAACDVELRVTLDADTLRARRWRKFAGSRQQLELRKARE